MTELNILKNLIENRQEIYERLAPRVNIVDILGNTYYKVQNSKLLYYIFNTHFKYYDKEINFAKDFALYFVNKNYKYELLENTQKVILDKKAELVLDDINYSLKVSEFIKSVQSNKGEDYMKGAYFYSREEIIRSVFNYYGYSRNIAIPIENTNCGIYLEQHINYHLCVSVYYNNNDIANKLREEPIKTEIGKILDKDSDKYEEDANKYYIYSRFVDIEKDKPEEIGQKIIDLYHLLKEKIIQ